MSDIDTLITTLIDGPNYGGIVQSPKSLVSTSNPIGLSWHNLTVIHKKSGRKILDNISGYAQPGQFIALMGTRFESKQKMK